MREFLSTPTAQVVVWLTILSALVVVAAFVVSFFRSRGTENRGSASDLLSAFRELHEKGDIDQKEFRSIKSVLGPRIQGEAGSKDAEQDV
jgi:hypothetical protein